MPLLTSSYRAPWFLRNGHTHTVYPALRREVSEVSYDRQRLELPDGDFLDLDWSRVGSTSLVLVCHGLEGSSEGAYVKGMVRAFNRRGWDAVALNFRGCSGEPNRLRRFYHSGSSDDLWTALEGIRAKQEQPVSIVGFSLGGNVTLKLLGELGEKTPDWLKGAVAISVPCDLKSSGEVMAQSTNRIYMGRFLRDLRQKLKGKRSRFPVEMDDTDYHRVRSFRDFDDRYTAPLHGFRDAEDYWARCSSRFFLDAIRCPALLINAADDPFLSAECFPRALAMGHRFVHLEIPEQGGHVGFVGGGLQPDEYYTERRALEFLGAL